MNKSAQEMLLDLRGKISALATSRVGPGDIHPGIISNIDEAVEALRTGRDRTGQSVSPERVASGLHRLVQYVSTPDWMALASASLAHDSTRTSMLKTYLFDLDQITKIIEQPSESAAPDPDAVGQEPGRDVTFSCPSCSQHIACDESLCGQSVPCPTCDTQIVVPSPGASSSPLQDNAPSSQEKETFVKMFASLKEVSERYIAMRKAFNDALLASARSALNPESTGSRRPVLLQMMDQEKEAGGIKQKLEELSTLDLVVRKGLIALGAQYVPVYVTAIESELDKGTAGNFRFMLALLDIVGELGRDAAAAVPVVTKVLKTNGGTVSEFAAGALGAIGGHEAVEALKCVRDQTKIVKERKNLFFTKEKVEHEFDSDLRKAATEALSKLGQN